MLQLRTCYDSTTPADIPHAGDLVLAYRDGAFADVDKVAATHPRQRLIVGTVTGATLDAHFADVEKGDLVPRSAARWAARKVTRDGYAGLYTPRSEWPTVAHEVRAELGARAELVWWFIADYTGHPHLPAGAVGCQYAWPPQTGGHYDVSCFVAYVPGVDPPPAQHHTPPHRHPAERPREVTVRAGDTLTGIAARLHVSDWRELYRLNQHTIGTNPDRLRVGDVLRLP